MCCSSWDRKKSDTTEWLNWTVLGCLAIIRPSMLPIMLFSCAVMSDSLRPHGLQYTSLSVPHYLPVMPSGHLILWRPLLRLPLKPETKRMEGGIHRRLWSILWKDESVVKLGLWKVENTFIIFFKVMRMNSNKHGKGGKKHIFEK